MGDCKLTRGQIYFIEVCNTPHILIVASLDMDTATFTWTGTAKRIFVSRVVKLDASVLHIYSNVDTLMRI